MRDFEKDRKICEAASKGPWDAYYGCCNNRVHGGPHYNIIAAGKELRTEDATFIAAAREGWPAALAEIESLKRQLQVAANTEACNGRCPETKECPTDRDCVDCWLEYWRQKANSNDNAVNSKDKAANSKDSGTFQSGNNHGTTSKTETVGEGAE